MKPILALVFRVRAQSTFNFRGNLLARENLRTTGPWPVLVVCGVTWLS